MSPHVNDMSTWSEITCQRGHDTHESALLDIRLGGPTPYHDYPPIPMRFAREFKMRIYPPNIYPVDGGPYCCAHDAVSETLVSHGVWEPSETILTLAVCSTAPAGSVMLDFGSQIGWFSLLAASAGLDVLAYDAEAENVRLLGESTDANGWARHILPILARIGADDAPFEVKDVPIRLAKIDVEGAEADVVRILWPTIEAGLVDHLLIEVSPVFNDSYPDLVCQLVDAGYRAYQLPPKRRPPARLADQPGSLPAGLDAHRLDDMPTATLRKFVAECHQTNLWFARNGASW